MNALPYDESARIVLSGPDAEAVLRDLENPPAPGPWLRSHAAWYRARARDDMDDDTT